MKRGDIIAGLIIGEASALLTLVVFRNLSLEFPFLWSLPVLLPLLSVVGLWIADLLGRKFAFLWQAAKFALVGALNTLIDLGVLNILILFSGIASGLWFSVFKGISFTVAVVNSYFWNKHWTFQKRGWAEGGEFFQFFVVALVGFGINVAAASVVVNFIGPQFGLGEKIWANVGAFVAVFVGMTWNFLGYKFIVFRR